MIDMEAAADLVKAANRAHELLTARIVAEPDSPVIEDLRTLANSAAELATEYTNLIAHHERRTA